jgi:mRNA interferase MazF
MTYAKGDVVLVAFPFRDRPAAKVRPAVVLSGPNYNRRGDVIIAAITTHAPRLSIDYPIQGWRKAGLVAPSVVRMQLATVAARRLLFRPGRIGKDDLARVDLLLTKVLELHQPKKT